MTWSYNPPQTFLSSTAIEFGRAFYFLEGKALSSPIDHIFTSFRREFISTGQIWFLFKYTLKMDSFTMFLQYFLVCLWAQNDAGTVAWSSAVQLSTFWWECADKNEKINL